MVAIGIPDPVIALRLWPVRTHSRADIGGEARHRLLVLKRDVLAAQLVLGREFNREVRFGKCLVFQAQVAPEIAGRLLPLD